MSGFSAHWLSLREPVDHASRNPEVERAMLDCLKQRHGALLPNLRVIDLGCGSGSNFRALAPLFGTEQHWTLVDYDPELLLAAQQAIREWAEVVEFDEPGQLVIRRATQTMTIRFLQADLNQEIEAILRQEPHDLVTAAALFDLISPTWIARFCGLLSTPFYTVLTYDGRSQWQPQTADDVTVVDGFHQHQQTDKGFGVAAGPDAPQVLAECLQARQWQVVRGDSPWQLDSKHRLLLDLFHEGMAQAVRQMGIMDQAQLSNWLASRQDVTQCLVGHEDTFAMPSVS